MKDRFLELSALRKQIQDLFHRLEEKKKGMKENYVALSTSNDNHFFGLDSFRFQVKLAENEFRFLQDQFILIDNRLYCDYYKLYHHIYEYYVTNLPAGIVKSIFPIYKDLEPTKVYEPELVHKLYKDILFLIHKAYDTLDHEHRKRESEKRLTTSGIHIGNYVHNRVFTDTLIKTNIELFEQYLNTYFIYHMTFLVNIKDRLVMFLDHVLRKQTAEQCTEDEVEDNFIQVVKDPNEPTIAVPHVAIDIAELPDEPKEEPNEVPDALSQSLIDIAESKEDAHPQPEAVAEEVPQPEASQPEAVAEEVPQPEAVAEEVPQPEAEPETIPETTDTAVQTTEPATEPQATEPTIEEVINPIIDHIQADLPAELQTEPKKKKRSRKK
jgi:hypothetical protein